MLVNMVVDFAAFTFFGEKRFFDQVVDIFELSKKVKNDPSLVAEDGLHPSAKEYAEWEKLILPAALDLLKTGE